jgi:hypothetical protein
MMARAEQRKHGGYAIVGKQHAKTRETGLPSQEVDNDQRNTSKKMCV